MSEENGQGVDAQGNWQGWYEGKASTPTESGKQTWDEGGPPAGDMSREEALKEIKILERDENFAGEKGTMDFWSRQRMLKRRDSLYRHAYPENVGKEYSGMAETLENLGVTQETLEADQEKFAERDFREEKAKAMESLKTYFGGEDEAKQALVDARAILKRFATRADLAYLDESGLGSDVNFIKRLVELGRMLNPKKEE